MNSLDRQILLGLRTRSDLTDPLGPDWVQRVATDVTGLGSHTVLILLVLVTAGFLLSRGRRGGAALVVGSAAGAMLLSTGLKTLFARARPDLVAHLVGVHTPSFPSGHALLSAAVYLLLGVLLGREFPEARRYCIAIAATLTLLIGVSRVYLGVHWPSDVLAGWCIGAAWAWGCSRVGQRIK